MDLCEDKCACGRPLEMVGVHVTPTTGGQFEVRIAASDTVEYLKKLVSKKLKVPKERICLLYREKHLKDGTLVDNDVVDGSRITLLPSVETGLLTQRPEQSVLAALESLNDGQVNDFLSGKAPLNLTMRLGDHMMLIQLQLSTVSPSPTSGGSSAGHSRRARAAGATGTPISSTSTTTPTTPSRVADDPHIYPHLSHHHHHFHHHSSPTAPHHHHRTPSRTTPSSPLTSDPEPPPRPCPHQSDPSPPPGPALDTRALADASRNLTQTLKQLSSEVLTSRPESQESGSTTPPCTASSSSSSNCTAPATASATTTSPASGKNAKKQGAIIETMTHHGKGVYSGTFSGTLNPALQDRQGRPKRDISTIIHILNDLLCATPQYRRPGPSSATRRRHAHASSRAPASAVSADAGEATLVADGQQENQTTRSKLLQLRRVMEQRRLRRKQRRTTQSHPYFGGGTALGGGTSATVVAAKDANPMEEGGEGTEGGASGGGGLCQRGSEAVVV